jgi:hypothetical protein
MKRFNTIMAGVIFALALVVAGGAQAAEFHAYAGTGDTSTATSTYGIGNTTLLGQGPALGALISQSTASSSGMVSGFDARSFTQEQRVNDETGMTLLSGGLNTQVVQGMQGFLHARLGVNLAGYFLPLDGFQVVPGFAVGYTSGIMGGGANLARMRVTPALSVEYKSVRLTYRQSPWSYGNGEHAPRDILFHVFFNGTMSRMTGMGVLTIGAVLPDTQNAVSDGFVVALKTPRLNGFGVRISYVGGLQGNAPQGPYNPSRPWDSYSRGVTVAANYHFHKGMTVGIFEGTQSNNSGSMTTTTITQVQTQGREVGLTLAHTF